MDTDRAQMITDRQARLLVRLGGYSYEEARHWHGAYAGRIIRELLANKSSCNNR